MTSSPDVWPEHRAAGIVTRGVAGGVDAIVVFLFAVVIVLTFRAAQFVWSPTTFTWNDVSIWGSLSLFIAIAIVYLTFAWAMIGRSYGQYLLGLRVLSRKRLKPGWALALLRAVFACSSPLGCSGSRSAHTGAPCRTWCCAPWSSTTGTRWSRATSCRLPADIRAVPRISGQSATSAKSKGRRLLRAPVLAAR